MSDANKIQIATELDLKLVYASVLRGYTSYKSRALKTQIYIKHLGIHDTIDSDDVYNTAFERAKDSNLPTDEEQKVYLEKQELWSEKKDLELAKLASYVSGLKETKRRLFLKSQIDPIKKDIKENEKKLTDLDNTRRELLGLTAEAFAAKKTNEDYIKHAIYTDKECQIPALPDDKFDDLTDVDLSTITLEYNLSTQFLTIGSLKRISIMPFFGNYFYLCEDNPQIFYGKAVVDLTYFQVELFAYGRYFKQMAQEAKAKPPAEIVNDPELLLEFYESRRNADEFMDKMNSKSKNPEAAGGTSIVGATKEDLEAIGYSTPGDNMNLSKLAEAKGGELNMQDFIDMHS